MSDTAYVRRLGLFAGITMSFTGAIGMIETFNNRILIDPFLKMGDLVLYLIPLGIGLLAARGEANLLIEPERNPGKGALKGAMAGVIGGAITSVFVLIVNTFDLTEFFPNMRDSMVDAMTFGLGVPTGIVALIITSAAAGAVGGMVFGLPESVRHGLARATAWVLSFALFEVVVTDLIDWFDPLVDFLYANGGGLQIWAAFIVGALAWWLPQRYEGRASGLVVKVREADPKSRLRRSVIALGAFSVIVLPMILGGILNELLINVSLFVLMGLGLNIVVGLAGLLDLGYVAFFAVGAYGTAVLTSPLSPSFAPGLNWWVALPQGLPGKGSLGTTM